jgi:transcriptional regulator with XRE-family HTH domain
MNQEDIIRAAMKKKGITQTALANAVGLKGQSSVADVMRRKTGMNLSTFIRLINAMGYNVSITDPANGNAVEWVVGEEVKVQAPPKPAPKMDLDKLLATPEPPRRTSGRVPLIPYKDMKKA